MIAGDIQTSKASGEDFIAWQFEILDGEFEGRVAYLNNSLQPQALWRLREVLEAFGTDVPEGAMDLDGEEYIGCEAEITIEETDYEGRRQSKVVEVMPLKKGRRSRDDDDPKPRGRRSRDEDPEEDPAPRGRRSRDEDPEEDPKPRGRRGKKKGITTAEVEEMDEDELQDLADEHDLDVDFKRLKTLKAKTNAVLDALDDAKLLDE